MTLTLADMIALVCDVELVDVLIQLCRVLEQQSSPPKLNSTAVQVSALETVARDFAPTPDVMTVISAALAHYQPPRT